jgi:hypothetical protein
MKKTQRGAYFVKVQIVTSSNTESHDLAAGGSPYFGPFCWIPRSHHRAFVSALKKEYSNVQIIDQDFRPVKGKLPTLQQSLRRFRQFLRMKSNWS